MSSGSECINEMVSYDFDDETRKCTNQGGSCKRGLCECDAAFAEGSNLIILFVDSL